MRIHISSMLFDWKRQGIHAAMIWQTWNVPCELLWCLRPSSAIKSTVCIWTSCGKMECNNFQNIADSNTWNYMQSVLLYHERWGSETIRMKGCSLLRLYLSNNRFKNERYFKTVLLTISNTSTGWQYIMF